MPEPADHEALATTDAEVRPDAKPTADDAPVFGEVVTLEAVSPSPEQKAADRANRKSRTAAQAFPAAAFVALAVYVALLLGADLNTDPETKEPPTEQVLGLGALVTYGVAVWMNRDPKDEPQEG